MVTEQAPQETATPQEGTAPQPPQAGADPSGGAGKEQGLTLNILKDSSMKWYRDQATGLFYVEYRLPGQGGFMIFEAELPQIEALFGRLEPPSVSTFDFNSYLRQQNVYFGGNVAEVEGEGNWTDEVNRTITLALDASDMPDWIKNDPKALDLLFIAVTEQRTDDWFYSQLSKLPSFKTRYPGAATLMGRGFSVGEAVRIHTQYETQLKSLHAAAGFGADAINPDIVGSLLKRGYSVEQVAESYQTWHRMQAHAPALQAFNRILESQGQKAMSSRDMYDFLQGKAPAEVYDLYEAASIQEAADTHGFGGIFNPEDALSIAMSTASNLTVDQAYQQFAGLAQQALRFRHELDVGAYGVNIEDLIDVSFGRAPRSGRTSAEIAEDLARITASAQGYLRDRIQPFVGFDNTGRPSAVSLTNTRQESL